MLRQIAETLKVTLLERHKLRQANLGRTKRVEQLYSYLASSTVSLRIRICFRYQLDHAGRVGWGAQRYDKNVGAKLQSQIERIAKNMGTVVDELQGIAQESLADLQRIDTLEALGLALPKPDRSDIS